MLEATAVGQLCDDAVVIEMRVGCEHAGAAAVGEDREIVARQMFGRAEDFDGVEQLVQSQHAQETGTLERRVVDGIDACECTGMRSCRFGRCRMPAGFDDDDGFGAGRGACGRHELPRLCHGFDIKQDRARVAVVRQEIEHVAEIDIGHVAQRHEMRKADTARARPVEHRRQHRA